MRLCRFRHDDRAQVGFYSEHHVVPLAAAAKLYGEATHQTLKLADGDDLIDFLPPAGKSFAAAKQLASWIERSPKEVGKVAVPTTSVELLVPIPRPNKLFLLAGNYSEHIKEGGGIAPERAETFPYVFMKPPSTTLVDPGAPIRVPKISPGAIDWECELAVVIGKRVKAIKEADALSVVAGYTVINDISDRKFRPNTDRKKREKDVFFDWLHGKWHDGFCPCGPCITSADAVSNVQSLSIELRVNGQVKQNSSTAAQIFPVAAVIEFISSFVTLEPGDIISTGTPSGVGNATGTFLKAGDKVEASIGEVGTLLSPVVAE